MAAANVVNGGITAEQADEPGRSSRIKYRVEYVGPNNNVLHQYETKGPRYEDEATGSRSHVLEILTTFKTLKEDQKWNNDTKFQSIGATPVRSMRILSKAVMQALRSVVLYYPSQDLTGDVINIASPYTVLVHHYDELMERREKFRPGTVEAMCYREKDAYEDLGILIAYLDEHVMPTVREEQARNARDYQTFDKFWVSMKPGSHIRGTLAGANEPYVGIVHSIAGGSLSTATTSWHVNYWTLAYDGRWVGRRMNSITHEPWDGEKNTAALDLKASSREQDIQDQIDKGTTYWSLLHHKQCKYYKGRTRKFPHNEIDGLVMVDMDAYYADNAENVPDLMDPTTDVRAWISDCTCSVCSSRRDIVADKRITLFNDYEIYFKGNPEYELQDHQYLLLPQSIWAYVFRTRTWELLDVSGFSEPKFDENMIENLVMDEKRVKMLKALAKSYARLNKHEEKSELDMWSADFVKGKGNGLTFLLHGTPGVGKTCTAECIAAFTRRPLMVLTSSDIGISPYEVESNLTRHFKQARSWGAVLLIDEADVFMERRSTADLNRNSLVAGFLRALEFYDGILFLTTNRVGAFDDAFISRIHIQLYYPEFDDVSRRKVWKTFIDKLRRERGDYIRLNIDAREYLEGKELRAVKWNGREIRNAFQTAVALAEYEAQKDEEGKIVLTDQHLKSVVEVSKDFKDYLNSLHRGDEAKRAERRNERLHDAIVKS